MIRRVLLLILAALLAVVIWSGSADPPSWHWVRPTAIGMLVIAVIWPIARFAWVPADDRRLIGPLVRYDLLRIPRRQRLAMQRVMYAMILFGILFVLYYATFKPRVSLTTFAGIREFLAGGSLPPRQVAEFAATFFALFLVLQFVTVVIMTPLYAAGVIAEEKEKRTLDFLLATDLRAVEIISGKLLARLVQGMTLVLTGLPMLSLLQFLGGVDPGVLLAAYTVTAITLVSLAALAVLLSVGAHTTSQAVGACYQAALLYAVIGVVIYAVTQDPAWAASPEWAPIRLGEAATVWNAGNPLVGMIEVGRGLNRGEPLDDFLPEILGDFALFHGLFTAACAYAAAGLLRPTAAAMGAVKIKAEVAAKDTPHRSRIRPRPLVGNFPLLWKEWHFDTRPARGRVERALLGLVALVALAPLVFILGDHFLYRPAYGGLGSPVNGYLRFVGPIVGGLVLLNVAMHASRALGRERDRLTLDDLMLTEISPEELLQHKWLGAFLAVRGLLSWLAIPMMVGLLSGGLSPLAVPVFLGCLGAYAAFAASLGLWMSVTNRMTQRAVQRTVIAGLAVTLLPWLFWLLLVAGPARSDWERYVFAQVATLTPPVVLGFGMFRESDLPSFFRSNGTWAILWVGMAITGLVLYLTLAKLLFWDALRRLNQSLGRSGEVAVKDGMP